MADETRNDNKTAAASTEEDEELSALLESAVADFDKVAKEDDKKNDAKSTDEAKPAPPDTLEWSDAFLRNNRNLSSLFSPGADGSFNMESFGQELQRLAEQTTQAAGFETSPDAEFSNIIAQTLRNLSEGANDIQNQFSEDDLMNMLGSLGNMSDDADPGELFPFMQKMMQNILSKEILLPALASLEEKYPTWLAEHRSTLPAEDVTRYEKQLGLVKVICRELEQETPEDSDVIKKTRFDKVLALMQEMQDCGHPPQELVGDLAPFLDEQGRPQVPPGSAEQCTIQ